jgi:glutamyl-tRNA reductase
MACNLQKHLTEHDQPALRYANRNLSKGDSLKELGAIPCQDMNELVQTCDVIFISVLHLRPSKRSARMVNV